MNIHLLFLVFCCCQVTKSWLTLCDPMDCSNPCFPVSHQLLEFAQVHVHLIGDTIQPSHPLQPSSSFAFKFSQNQVFSNELPVCITWPKYWSFSFSISPSNEYSGLISLRIDWFDLLGFRGTFFFFFFLLLILFYFILFFKLYITVLVLPGTLKSLLQQRNSKTSIIWCSAFFMVQLSYPFSLLERP